MSAKLLIITSIILGLAVISASSFLAFQKTGFNVLVFLSNTSQKIGKTSASVAGSIVGFFESEKKDDNDNGKNKIADADEPGQQNSSQNPAKQTIGLNGKSPSDDSQENLTQKLSMALAETAYITDLDPEAAQDSDILDAAISKANIDPDKIFALPEILDEDIKISSDNSKINIQLYISKMTGAMSYGALPMEYFEELQEKGLENIDPEDLPKIEQLLGDYKKSIEEAAKIEVPSTWEEIHKEQLSILKLTSQLLETILGQENDPLKASLAIEKLYQVSDFLDQTAEKMFNLSQEQQLFAEYQ